MIAASAAGLVYILLTAHGMVDSQGRPLGTDFSNVYAAGTYVLEGHPAAPFDPALQYAREQAIFGEATPFYGWHYPPFFLGVAALLALMPYALALALWQGVTLLGSMCWRSGRWCSRRRRARAPLRQPTRCGSCSPSPSRPCSSISATATTAFSPRR